VELLYLTTIVMSTKFLVARDPSTFQWIYLMFSTITYVLLVTKVLLGAHQEKTLGKKEITAFYHTNRPACKYISQITYFTKITC
jgi:hypothetical protein